eukprot:Gregarina_sp_Poly_1__10874@NODE_847_length_5991_cov_96_588623_g612_i0_p1_GENE_NODE_847_length_5991_cov_96_588623_g612_i0NODE_847_length_5991_cov_96_588623_g612_i0_p1_ORF_typecomplete_len641_score86_79Peptidase_C14/PF00656_22/1_6e56Peptidase_C13/PF01650_18/3_6e05Raptor_N/PF14538_6/2_5e03Raptor_N/PF14538_6/0_0027_NODE_847_length_5991_cov_96_588623_g612_i024994421
MEESDASSLYVADYEHMFRPIAVELSESDSASCRSGSPAARRGGVFEAVFPPSWQSPSPCSPSCCSRGWREELESECSLILNPPCRLCDQCGPYNCGGGPVCTNPGCVSAIYTVVPPNVGHCNGVAPLRHVSPLRYAEVAAPSPSQFSACSSYSAESRSAESRLPVSRYAESRLIESRSAESRPAKRKHSGSSSGCQSESPTSRIRSPLIDTRVQGKQPVTDTGYASASDFNDQSPEHLESTAVKVSALISQFPKATIGDALRALSQCGGNLQESSKWMLDQMLERASKLHEARQLAETAVHEIFPQSLETQSSAPGPSLLSAPAPWVSYADMVAGVQSTETHAAVATSIAPLMTMIENRVRPSGRRKALLIGITYANTAWELEGPAEDTRRIRQLLTRVYGFPDHPTSLCELTDAPRDAVANSAIYVPTRENMLKAFDWLTQNAQAGDVLFFHYSGHGGQTPATDGMEYEVDGLDETIMPVDFQSAGELRDDDLNKYLVQRIRNGVKLVVLMDCCHSGTGLDLPWTCDISVSSQWKKQRVKFEARGDISLIAGCRADQTSADVRFGRDHSGGAMTMAFLSAICVKPFRHTYLSLLAQMNRSLKGRGFQQKVQLSGSVPFSLQRRFSFNDIIHNDPHISD